MKFRNKTGFTIMSSIAVLFVSIADLVTVSSSFMLWGETKCPKELIK